MERRVALLNVFFSRVGMDFDRVTRTDTCKRLMATLRPEDLNQYLNHCYRVLLQPNVHGERKEND